MPAMRASAVLLLLSLSALFLPSYGRRHSTAAGKGTAWRALEAECRTKVCDGLPDECVQWCKAPVCYLRAFGLPPGYDQRVSRRQIEQVEAEITADGTARAPLLPATSLEPGEVDHSRTSAYQGCLKKLEKALRQGGSAAWPPSLDADAGHLKMPQSLYQSEEFGPLLKIAAMAAAGTPPSPSSSSASEDD